MMASLALLPILLILILMLGARWSAARAGSVGALAAVGIAVLAFDFPGETHPDLALGSALAGTLAESGFTVLTILCYSLAPGLGSAADHDRARPARLARPRRRRLEDLGLDSCGFPVFRDPAPYLVLVAVVLVTRLVPPIREALQGIVID